MSPQSEGFRRRLHRNMMLSREFETGLADAWFEPDHPIPGALYLAVGHEPVAVGVCEHLRATDALCSGHRPIHHAVAKGVDLRRLAAEIFGRAGGLSGGRGGCCHLIDSEHKFSTTGMVGGGAPEAVGRAFASARAGTGDVAIAFFGEGAVNQGVLLESLNLAAVWKAPVIFVCEDNEWAISVPGEQSRTVEDLSDRAAGFGIPGIFIDRNDPEVVYERLEEPIRRARAGEGPSFVHAKTLSMYPHGIADPPEWRPVEEDERARQLDGLRAYEQRLQDEGVLSDEGIAATKAETKSLVDDAIEFARASPPADATEALKHVFL